MYGASPWLINDFLLNQYNQHVADTTLYRKCPNPDCWDGGHGAYRAKSTGPWNVPTRLQCDKCGHEWMENL